jgi:hypothetical protein
MNSKNSSLHETFDFYIYLDNGRPVLNTISSEKMDKHCHSVMVVSRLPCSKNSLCFHNGCNHKEENMICLDQTSCALPQCKNIAGRSTEG